MNVAGPYGHVNPAVSPTCTSGSPIVGTLPGVITCFLEREDETVNVGGPLYALTTESCAWQGRTVTAMGGALYFGRCTFSYNSQDTHGNSIDIGLIEVDAGAKNYVTKHLFKGDCCKDQITVLDPAVGDVVQLYQRPRHQQWPDMEVCAIGENIPIINSAATYRNVFLLKHPNSVQLQGQGCRIVFRDTDRGSCVWQDGGPGGKAQIYGMIVAHAVDSLDGAGITRAVRISENSEKINPTNKGIAISMRSILDFLSEQFNSRMIVVGMLDTDLPITATSQESDSGAANDLVPSTVPPTA